MDEWFVELRKCVIIGCEYAFEFSSSFEFFCQAKEITITSYENSLIIGIYTEARMHDQFRIYISFDSLSLYESFFEYEFISVGF